MKIKDLQINDLFKTFSGEVFQKISICEKGKRQNTIFIKQIRTDKLFTEAEFDDMLIEKIEIKSLNFDEK